MIRQSALLRSLRRATLLLALLGAAYLVLRFDLVNLPDGSCSPLRRYEAGDRLIVDRRPSSVEVGDFEATIAAQIEGEGVEIALNVRFLLDALQTIDYAQVEILFNEPSRPAMVRPAGDEGLRHVIMPMHVRG